MSLKYVVFFSFKNFHCEETRNINDLEEPNFNRNTIPIPPERAELKFLDLGQSNSALGPTALGQNWNSLGQEIFNSALSRGIGMIYFYMVESSISLEIFHKDEQESNLSYR